MKVTESLLHFALKIWELIPNKISALDSLSHVKKAVSYGSQ